MKRVRFMCGLILLCAAAVASPVRAQQAQEDLRKQIGTIIVTPGNGPALAVADFQPRAGGVDAATATFNEVLWNDLKFAGVANLVGRSLYPKTRLADPASLRYEEWTADPVKADYVAFGSITGAVLGGIVSRIPELVGGSARGHLHSPYRPSLA